MWYPLYKLYLPCGQVLKVYLDRVEGLPRGTLVINHVKDALRDALMPLPRQKPPWVENEELCEDW